MSDEIGNGLPEISIDVDNLYCEETFTDLKLGRIKRLTPISPDGTEDKARKVLFIGQTQLMSNAGPIPLSCPIEARNLKKAADKFPEAMRRAVNEFVEQAKEMQRKEASRIVVPGVETTQKIVT